MPFCDNVSNSNPLPEEPAKAAAQKLMQLLKQKKHINFEKKSDKSCESLKTDFLYGEARGKMFGVLVCQTLNGGEQILKAFSGQYNGIWEVDGWVPPLFNVQDFWTLTTPVEKRIKDLGREMEGADVDPEKRSGLQKQRKKLSQELMKQVHSLYRLHNFKNQSCHLTDLFPDKYGIPTGTGDCCAPKLLNYAAIHKLKPLGLTEFYWGKTNKSSTRHQGQFYPACKDKCGPILGFFLQGLESL